MAAWQAWTGAGRGLKGEPRDGVSYAHAWRHRAVSLSAVVSACVRASVPLCASTGVFLCDTFYSIFIISMQFSLFYNNSKIKKKLLTFLNLYKYLIIVICVVTGFKLYHLIYCRIIHKSTILLFISILCLKNLAVKSTWKI